MSCHRKYKLGQWPFFRHELSGLPLDFEILMESRAFWCMFVQVKIELVCVLILIDLVCCAAINKNFARMPKVEFQELACRYGPRRWLLFGNQQFEKMRQPLLKTRNLSHITQTLLTSQGQSQEEKLVFFCLLSLLPSPPPFPPNLDNLYNFFSTSKFKM